MGFVIPEIPPADRGIVSLDPTGGASSGGQGVELGEKQVSRDGAWGGKGCVFKPAPANGCSVGLQSAGLDISRCDGLQGQAGGRSGPATVIVSPAVGCAIVFHSAGVQGANADGREFGLTPASVFGGACGDGVAACTGAMVGGGASVAGGTVGGADAVGVVVAAGTDVVEVGSEAAVAGVVGVGRGSGVASGRDVATSVASGSGGTLPRRRTAATSGPASARRCRQS